MTHAGEITIQFFSLDPTCEAAISLDLYPPLVDSELDNVDAASAWAKVA